MRIRSGPITSPRTSTLPIVLVTTAPASSRVGKTANALGATAKLKKIIEPSHTESSKTSTKAMILEPTLEPASEACSVAIGCFLGPGAFLDRHFRLSVLQVSDVLFGRESRH